MSIFCKASSSSEPNKSLNEKEVSLKLAQKIANICIWEWDYKKDRLYFTEEFCQVCGIGKDVENISLQFFIDNFICKDYKNMVKDALKEALISGSIEEIEYKIVKTNKEERWVRTNCQVIYDDGEPHRVIGTIQDITEWRKNEASFQENLEFLKRVIDTLPNPIFYKDSKGIYKHCNIALTEFLGIEHKNIIDSSVYDIYPKELADIYYGADNELMKNGGKQTYEAKSVFNDGSLRDVIFNKAVIRDHEGVATGLVGVVIDITERKLGEKRIQRLLKLKEASLEINHAIIGINDISDLFNLILEKASDIIENAELGCVMLLDKDENLQIAACKGYDRDIARDYRLKLRETFFWLVTKGEFHSTVIINDIQDLVKNKFPSILDSKDMIKVQSSISSPIIVGGKLYGLVNIDSSSNYIYDEMDLEMMEYLRNQIAIVISKHKLYEETIYLSRYDKLTSIYNRSYFEELFKVYIKEAIKYNREFYLVLFDLNSLKFVNDTYGHLAGDRLIKAFSNSLSEFIEPQNILARFGGDEFIAVFENEDLYSLKNRFKKLSNYLKNEPIIFEGNRISCGFSYGIARFPEDSNEYSQLVRVADERMYTFKKRLKKIHEAF